MNEQTLSPVKEDAVKPSRVPLTTLPVEDGVTTSGIPESGIQRAPVERVAPPPPAKDEDNGVLAEFIHQYLRSYIALADQKAAVLFTAVSAVLAYLAGKGALQPLEFSSSRATVTWSVCFGLLASLDLILSATLAIAVISPRLTPGPPSMKGLIFWEDICSHDSAVNYASAFKGLSKAQAAEQMQMNCYVLARICRKKYRTLNYAIWFATAGFALSVVYITIR
jgi:hypothetical protein